MCPFKYHPNVLAVVFLVRPSKKVWIWPLKSIPQISCVTNLLSLQRKFNLHWFYYKAMGSLGHYSIENTTEIRDLRLQLYFDALHFKFINVYFYFYFFIFGLLVKVADLIFIFQSEWLTLLWRRSLSHRNQSNDLLSKSMD